jgi:mannose-1-phosphate guanylyltransferase
LPESTKSSHAEAPLWAVILAGGVGSRFWPISTPSRPKQLLPLGSERPLIVDTVDRILPLVPLPRLRILTGPSLAAPIQAEVPQLSRDNLLLEPVARGTAPVLVWAAHEIARRDPDAVMLSLHADHVIEPAHAFRDLLARVGRLAAEERRLFTIGIEPTRPETGYGYIHVGPPLGSDEEAFEVADFVEKPDRDTAQEYLHRGGYLWNSGIFVWRVGTLLEEIERHTPELAALLPRLAEGDIEGFFRDAPNLSIDEGLLERSDRVAVARATFRWDDVGAWDAVARTRPADENGNLRIGDAHLVESDHCIAWADQGTIVVFGASNLVVVRTRGITFVAPRDRTADLKTLLKELPDSIVRQEG